MERKLIIWWVVYRMNLVDRLTWTNLKRDIYASYLESINFAKLSLDVRLFNSNGYTSYGCYGRRKLQNFDLLRVPSFTIMDADLQVQITQIGHLKTSSLIAQFSCVQAKPRSGFRNTKHNTIAWLLRYNQFALQLIICLQ